MDTLLIPFELHFIYIVTSLYSVQCILCKNGFKCETVFRRSYPITHNLLKNITIWLLKYIEEPDRTEFRRSTVTTSIWKYWCRSKLHLFPGRTMKTSETVLRWEVSLCHLDVGPLVYQGIGEHMTGLLSDKLPQTCESLFPPGTSFATSVMFVHRILPSRSPRLNVIGRYTDCSPITGLWMFAMGDSGALQPCAFYIGMNVDDYTTCRYRCDTGDLVSYIVLGMSNRRASSTSDTAAICDIAMVWGPSPILYNG